MYDPANKSRTLALQVMKLKTFGLGKRCRELQLCTASNVRTFYGKLFIAAELPLVVFLKLGTTLRNHPLSML